ncbi:MAG: hypothetical protein SFX73_27730 [Kofleriaceae bacterium]|nr:hypothetical protein [Kofleriaceae bacterium]
MVKTAATIAFIAASAGAAVYFAQRETIARGDVIEADLMKLLESRGITKVDCDDRIPIGRSGASFHCRVEQLGGGSRIRFRMDREGRISAD